MNETTKKRILKVLLADYARTMADANRARASFRRWAGPARGAILAAAEREESEAFAALRDFDPDALLPHNPFTA